MTEHVSDIEEAKRSIESILEFLELVRVVYVDDIFPDAPPVEEIIAASKILKPQLIKEKYYRCGWDGTRTGERDLLMALFLNSTPNRTNQKLLFFKI